MEEVREDNSELIDRSAKVQAIKADLLDRFGKTAKFNPQSGTMEIQEATFFDDPQVQINMMGNCGAVSRIVNDTIKGEVQTLQANGKNPEIIYLEKKLADGRSSAFHAYVVDETGFVWDPLANIWGDVDLNIYLENLQSTSE